MSKTNVPFLSPDEEAKIKAVYETMSEKDRRRYAASLSLTLPSGGCGYLCGLFGCSESTLTRGRKELNELHRNGDPAEERDRREGAGRPPKEVTHPELPDHLEDLLEERTAGDPKDPTVCWTHLMISPPSLVF